MPQVKEVLEMVIEEKGDVNIDDLISKLPKGKQKEAATELITQLHNRLSNVLVEQKLADAKVKKLSRKIAETEPMKALKQLKAEVKRNKKDGDKLALVLLGARKMATALGVEVSNIKLISEDI